MFLKLKNIEEILKRCYDFYMLDIYQTLEINNVLNDIASRSRSEIAKDKLLSLRMFNNFDDIKNELVLLDEMMSLQYRYNRLPIVNSFNLIKYVESANKNGILTPLDFSQIVNDIDITNNIIRYFQKIDNKQYPHLSDLVNGFNDLSSLKDAINRVILPNLEISSNASEKLKEIRNNIGKIEQSIRKMSLTLVNSFDKYLSDKSITFRNDHFVLAVKTSDKSKVPGIIHDVSDSGQTTFIEPNALVELSNELYLVKNEEREEIIRLLKELTALVNKQGEAILKNNAIIARLDFLDCKANYGISNDASVASLEKERLIDIKGLSHPLINKEVAVRNDFYLDENSRIIIISGPNAGGKTVALKTLGIAVMMNQMGLPVLSSNARLSFFPRIYADIGDNQSLLDNLSTFAAHISNLSTITHFVSSSDLVLLDELGTGTSPNEGEAIALSVTDFLLNKKCFAIISSHFERMKEYAYRKKEVINAMMVFDERHYAPTYILKMGYPGRSYGLIMAKRYHLDERVIEEATKYLNKNKDRSINDVLDKLNKVVRENEDINKSLKEKEKILYSKEKELNYKEKTLNKKSENLLSDVNETKEKMLKEAEEEITNILRITSSSKLTQKELIEARNKLRKLNETDEIEEPIDIKLNDYVELKDLGLVGKVVAIKGDKVIIISVDGMRINTTLNKLCLSTKPIVKKYEINNVDELIKDKMNVKMELNIIGEHVDEGVSKVAKYLDDARLKHYSTVRIIHGSGSGALRKAVHEYLKTCSFVKEFHYGGYFDGGSGATIVSLK